jgi:hypothetical protein
MGFGLNEIGKDGLSTYAQKQNDYRSNENSIYPARFDNTELSHALSAAASHAKPQ